MGKTDQLDAVALILAGGRGKRMDILCSLRPKPSLPIAGNFRVIDFVLSNCLHSGIKQVAALVDYQRTTMSLYFEEWQASNQGLKSLNVLIPKTSSYSGTANAVYQNLDYLSKCKTDVVLVLAGDHIYKMDYCTILDFHHKSNADVTVGVVSVPIEQAHRFGIVNTDNEGRIVDFVEKPKIPRGNLVSMGIYVFNKEVLCDRIREDASRTDSSHDFGYAIIPDMIMRDRAYAYKFSGYWQDIGTVESYYQANMELTRPKPSYSLDSNWHILTQEICSSPPIISKQGSVRNSLVSSGCLIKGQVENSILSPGVVIEEQAVVRNSVIMADTHVGYHSVVERSIVDQEVTIGEYCYIGFGNSLVKGDWGVSILGTKVVVPPYTAVCRNCKILPHVGKEDFTSKVVPSGSIVSKPSRNWERHEVDSFERR